MNRKVLRGAIGAISVIGLICSIMALFPYVQRIIIGLAERFLIHRKVNFYGQWMRTLQAWAKGCIALIIIFDFFVISAKGRVYFEKIMKEIKGCLPEISFKLFVKPVLLLSGIYSLGIASIIRANFSYVDDISRAIEGYHGWNGWSRHIADILSTFIHADSNLTDISPLPQLLAMFIVAAGSVLLVYILCDGKITLLTVLAGIPIGLSPYFLENISYKFDAPYMALSVFAGIVPFLFIKSKRAFVFSSIVSLLVMCMTYQASSGIYIMITIMLCFQDWNGRRKTNREIIGFAGSALFSFCFALIFFRLIFMVPGSGSGVSTAGLPLRELIPGVLKNIHDYTLCISNDLGMVWKVITAIICVLFVIQTARISARKRVFALLVSGLVIVISFIMSYGAYLVLESPSYAPRALYGFGIFIAIISICIVSHSTKSAVISTLALNWCFIVFAFSYGNALADQKRYTDFRIELLLQDLGTLFPDRDKSEMLIQMENQLGFGPITENIAKHYPVIRRLVPNNHHYHAYHYLVDYFHWGMWDSVTKGFDPADLPVMLDTYYHTIKSDGLRIVVLFKN
jgi:hypothetical protein